RAAPARRGRRSSGRVSGARLGDGPLAGLRDLLEHAVERERELPLRIVGAEAGKIGDVADVVAAAGLADVFGLQLAPDQGLEALDSLEHRDAVLPPAA